jgi:hypothetical protein
MTETSTQGPRLTPPGEQWILGLSRAASNASDKQTVDEAIRLADELAKKPGLIAHMKKQLGNAIGTPGETVLRLALLSGVTPTERELLVKFGLIVAQANYRGLMPNTK